MNSQHEDLVKAKEQLLDVINRINTQTREMFTETFNKIRENFANLFTEVFGGGKADNGCEPDDDRRNGQRIKPGKYIVLPTAAQIEFQPGVSKTLTCNPLANDERGDRGPEGNREG